MKEIKFKAKAINRDENRTYRSNYKNGDWVYGLLTKHKGYYGCATMTDIHGIEDIDIDEDTLRQFTGYVDVYGNEVYEEDYFTPIYVPPFKALDINSRDFDDDRKGKIEFKDGGLWITPKYGKSYYLSNYNRKIFDHYESNVGEIYKPIDNILCGKVEE